MKIYNLERKRESGMKQYKDLISLSSYKGTFGAAIGDIYGSYYEFQFGPKTPKSEIAIHDESTYTDDTVLTVAVADYLENKARGDKKPCSYYLQKWARKYIHAGYGNRFVDYIYQENPQPYRSYGNGSAMRVSAAAYFAKDFVDAQSLAIEVTEPTHNHVEGLKGAKCIASCIYMALHGSSREEIGRFASKHYDLNLDYAQLAGQLGHGEEICQVTVPQALWCFLHSDSFDDCLRLCLHIRWDADTLAAIACPIAEAYYKEIPEEAYLEARKRLPEEMIEVLEKVPKPQIFD